MPAALEPTHISDVLRELSEQIGAPLWLFGGVAVDFIVGRWTRPHGDIDLNAWATDRPRIEADLRRLGYHSLDTGWLTHWEQAASGRRFELVFLEQEQDGAAVLVIRPGDPVGTPGRHPTVPGYLDPQRWAELDGVRFRVCRPLGEYQARLTGARLVAGRTREPRIEHDLALLERWLRDHGEAEALAPRT